MDGPVYAPAQDFQLVAAHDQLRSEELPIRTEQFFAAWNASKSDATPESILPEDVRATLVDLNMSSAAITFFAYWLKGSGYRLEMAAVDPTPQAPMRGLTARQAEVLASIRDGLSNKSIAARLNMAEETVKVHVRTIFRVMGVTNRTQAAIKAGWFLP